VAGDVAVGVGGGERGGEEAFGVGAEGGCEGEGGEGVVLVLGVVGRVLFVLGWGGGRGGHFLE